MCLAAVLGNGVGLDESRDGAAAGQELKSLMDIGSLKEILHAFTTTTGIMADIVDENGVSVFSEEDAIDRCRFCRLIMETERGRKRCQNAYRQAGRQAFLFGESCVFRCPAGLVEWAVPIVVNGENLGSIICGQVLMWEPEEYFWIELREMNREIISDFRALFKAVEELPVVSSETVEAASNLLFIIADYIARSGWESRRRSRELERQKRHLQEVLDSHKKLEARRDQVFIRSMDQESALMEAIRKGESQEAERLLEEVIGDIVLGSKGNLELIRTRAIELIVLLSRMAAGTGVPQERVSQINASLIPMVQMQTSVDGISDLLTEAAGVFEKEIRTNAARPQSAAAKAMRDFIETHFSEDITLDDIASHAHISTSYASRLFKREYRISVMEYLTSLRIREASGLLADTTMRIEEIAYQVGYEDAGYFTKVFRKTQGMTPSQYRAKIHSSGHADDDDE